LSLPRWARFLLARDPMLITRSLEIALRTIFAHQLRRAPRAGALAPRHGSGGCASALRKQRRAQLTEQRPKRVDRRLAWNDVASELGIVETRWPSRLVDFLQRWFLETKSVRS
jgi:hypothetical protein